ncbi:hypothetical protein LTR53_001809 [Teratosphaeriaceae sp. CCFEE 6253]|nr:hypothetical protein LTR53_001809 [Teratosphaeriaceae sp. CCFEE 6253]
MIRGERFEVNLESEDEGDSAVPAAPLPGSFVNDVLERQLSQAKAPTGPTLKHKTGFPEHKKRPVESWFKQRQQAATQRHVPTDVGSKEQSPPTHAGDPTKPKSWEDEERRRIDEENRQRLADMSPAQLEEERQELLGSLSPSMIERLLKRSNIASGSNETDLSGPPEQPQPTAANPEKSQTKSVSFADEPEEPEPSTNREVANDPNQAQDHPDVSTLPHDSVHFPHPSQPPDLDPSSATFLTDLHEKYFPSLPPDPDKLAWMQPPLPHPNYPANPYDPAATALHAKDIRFAFTGALLPPRTAAQIPVTAGLHHHGDAPEAAGYTIAELAHLSRSIYPAQRCLAFQTLGRVLYRLGRGEFGDPGEPDDDFTGAGAGGSLGELARGLWHEVEQQRVIETLVRESEGLGADGGRHVSARAYATEAVHLWRKGGGRRWKAS